MRDSTSAHINKSNDASAVKLQFTIGASDQFQSDSLETDFLNGRFYKYFFYAILDFFVVIAPRKDEIHKLSESLV
jgi:hypothetical protein